MVEVLTSEIVDYESAVYIMEERLKGVISGNEDELVWFLEHPPIYTAGVSAVGDELLDSIFPVYASSRGGKFTYHGPGQRVVYLILNLKERRYEGVIEYILDLARWIVDALKMFGIYSFFDRELLGIWVYDNNTRKKIASFGVRIRKWVSYHGLSLNVCNDLSHYSGIIPCGISQYGVASMHSIGCGVNMYTVDVALKYVFYKSFYRKGLVHG